MLTPHRLLFRSPRSLLASLCALAACNETVGVDAALFACDSDADCDPEYVCLDDGSLGRAVCRPRGSTPSAPGSVCELVEGSCDAGDCDDSDYCQDPETKRVWLPAGSFAMGCNGTVDTQCEGDESPQHHVDIAAFTIDEFEVTAANYAICVSSGGCTPADSACNASPDSQRPSNCVTWSQARTYCQVHGGDLCSEAQWELAARRPCELIGGDCPAGMPTYPWGDDPPSCELAVKDHDGPGCGTGAPLDVGSLPDGTSVYGAKDMAGNVFEWVLDCYHPDFDGAPADGSAWGDDCAGDTKVVKGGGYASAPSELRAAGRMELGPDTARDDVGFRCCAD